MRARNWKSWLQAPARHAGTISIGTVAGQAVLFLASPFLTRLYTPAEFGVFSVIMGLSTLLATLCALSYPVAIPLANARKEASELVWLTILASLVIAPLGGVASGWFLRQQDSDLHQLTSQVLVAATAVLLATWGALRAFASREDQFRTVAVSGILDSSSQAGTQLGLGHTPAGSAGLATGYLAGKLAAVGYLFWGTRRHLHKPHRPWRSARTWVRYSLWSTPATLLNQSSVTAIGPFVASLYGAGIAGQFSLATRMLAIPSALIGQAIATVLFPKIARMTREGKSTLLAVQSVASALASIAWPVFSVTALLGPELFAFVFGAPWREAGTAASILSPWLALSLVSSPISSVATVHERLRPLLALGLLEASLRFGALALGYVNADWHLSLAAYSAAGCAISLYTVGWAMRLSGGSLTGWLRSWPLSHWLFIAAVIALAALKSLLPGVPFLALAVLLCLIGGALGLSSLVRLLKS